MAVAGGLCYLHHPGGGQPASLAAFLRPIEADLGLDRSVLSTAGAGSGLLALGAFALLFGPTYIANQAAGARLVRDRYGVRAVGVLMGSVGLAHQVAARWASAPAA